MKKKVESFFSDIVVVCFTFGFLFVPALIAVQIIMKTIASVSDKYDSVLAYLEEQDIEFVFAFFAAACIAITIHLCSKYKDKYQCDHDNYVKEVSNRENALSKRESDFEQRTREKEAELSQKEKILDSKSQSYPFAANILADTIKNVAIEESNQLLLKRHPAHKAAVTVREYAQQLKQWTTRAKLAENQLAFYEELFPWLEEFKEIPPNDAWDMVKGTDSAETEYDHYRNWLSPEEYNRLSRTERNQLALDRYKKRHKTNWEIGIEYERYVGYKYEMRGFRVSYIGATQGLEDMGRDLVAQNNSKTYIIQCKRWAQEKTIHEKHIFQLYGTTVLYKMSHPTENIQPLFVTTADLSDTAKEVAEYLNITIVNNYVVEEYPLIKCNIGKDGEKIYHMPFDQQYDHVVVTPSKGEGYTYTVEEAERLGFRHAYRWHSG